MSSEKPWHYLKVNKGRYLCLKHGGFCDVADGYAKKCPLCDENVKGNETNWEINPVDTALQIVRNLQARSMNRFYLIYGVTGFLGLLSLFEGKEIAGYLSNADCIAWGFLALFGLSFIASSICYLFSMGHVKTTDSGDPPEFLEKTIAKWETYMEINISKFEWYHTTGNRLLALSGGSIILFIIAQLILPLIYK